MELEAFAEITYRVLQDTPLELFIPTLCLPERDHIMALEGIPAEKEVEMRTVVLKWAESTASEGEEFLLAYRDGDGYFRIIRRSEGRLREALYPKTKS